MKTIQELKKCYAFVRATFNNNCDSCVNNEHCGFCALKEGNAGYCLKLGNPGPHPVSGVGPCKSPDAMGDEYRWDQHSCKTTLTPVFIAIMLFYLLAFSCGYAPLPWVMNAEFYPLWARSTCVSIATMCNWIFNLVISLTFISISQSLQKYGAYYLYAGFTSVALLFIYFFVPETRGCPIDEVEMLFMSKEVRERALSKKRIARNGNDKNITVIQLS
ncbi:hypothetical protein RB195_001598 [Necator americanus]|uniref:Major facilitator superfamily (MFS) profile domain-containing protein n=1 Tax=Necator americanus TaxID=51031 RepID=A0ABR1DF27_NECAM